MKTWHYEIIVVGIILSLLTLLFANNIVNWITTAAVLLTFNHCQIADRLQEKQGQMDKPSVDCYWLLNKIFAAKEIVWMVAFFLMKNYAALVGTIVFALYPIWRGYYRRKIKPLKKSINVMSATLDDEDDVLEQIRRSFNEENKTV